MHASALQGILEHLRKLTNPIRGGELSDADLLERFRLHREEAAFTLLVQRHGPMVFAVCRRILRDTHEAEDAFQATFLVLVRNAGTIRKQQSLASWLHGVAARIAHKTRLRTARQQAVGQAFQPDVYDDPSDSVAADELRAALDEEIALLPAKYRTPLVLCYLAEKTHEQAAGELGWPKSSVTARLAKARALLQQRLVRRGFTAPAGLLAALLTESSAQAAVPSLLTLATVRLAVQTLAGETLPLTMTAALADGFAKGSLLVKWTASLTLLAIMGMATVIGYRLSAIGYRGESEAPAAASQTAGRTPAANAKKRKPHVDWQGDPLPDGVLVRVGSGRMRHSGHVSALAYSPDGKSLVSGGDNGLRVWDTFAGKLQQRIEKLNPLFDLAQGWNHVFALHRGGIIAANVGPQKRIVTVHFIDLPTGTVRRRVAMKDQAATVHLAIAPDGGRVAFPLKNAIGLFDTSTGERTSLIDVPEGSVSALAFAPEGKSLALVPKEDTIRLHDASSGKLIRTLRHDGDTIVRIYFSPDGRFLASTTWNAKQRTGEASIWDMAAGLERHRLKPPSSYVHCVAFSPDGKYVAMGGPFDDVLLCDMATGREVRRLDCEGYVTSIAFAPDGKSLAAVAGGSIRQWEPATGRVLPASANPFASYFHSLRFDAAGKRLQFGGMQSWFVWDTSTGRELERFPRKPDECWDFSPDGTRIAGANREEKIIHLRDAKTGEDVRVLKGHTKRIWSLAFSPDGRRLISTSEDGTIRIWDVASGRELRKIDSPNNRYLTIAPNGRWLATANNRNGRFAGYEIVLWDLRAGRETRRLSVTTPARFVIEMCFSPDSRWLAVGGGADNKRGELKVWDVVEGKLRYAFEGHSKHVVSLAFSPDSRVLATGDLDGKLILWELASGRRRHTFPGHESGIFSLAFSPDGRTLAAASFDAPVYIWDVADTRAFTRRFHTHEDLQHCWSNLMSADAAGAFQAIRSLAAAPQQSLPFLREHLKPVPAPELPRVRQLVAALNSDDFQTRQQATEELEKQTDATAALLRQIVAKEKPSLETRRRLQQIIQAQENTTESLRAARAVEVLEWIGTPEAVRLIGELAKGAAEARLTREAAAARRRLQR